MSDDPCPASPTGAPRERGIPTIQFEARLWRANHSVTQKEEKTVVTLHVHPSEAEPLMNGSIHGKRFQVVMAEIGDDEQPVGVYGEPIKPKDHSYSTRAVMRCKDVGFQEWVFARADYQAPIGVETAEEKCAVFLRWYCGITSRSQLNTNQAVQAKFDHLQTEYYAATRTPERR